MEEKVGGIHPSLRLIMDFSLQQLDHFCAKTWTTSLFILPV